MSPKLLVVDDERQLTESIADYFDAHGYQVDVANELEEAEALVVSSRYDVVITDLRLTPTAHEEGLELLSFVRQRWPRTLMLVLTAFPTAQSEMNARMSGACMLLHKPQPLAEVEECVRSLLNGCPIRGCAELCSPFARGLGSAHEDLRSFLLLFKTVSRAHGDPANAATLRELQRMLLRIKAEAPPSVIALLASCLSGSDVLNELLQATAREQDSADAARRLAAEIARLTGDA